MNKYLIAAFHYFKGYQYFVLEAGSKVEALTKAKEKIKIYGSGNYRIDDIKVVKKLK